jgi:hypothetical protein
MTCPKCKGDRAHRTERVGAVDNAASWFLLKPYSCRGCSHRFYGRRKDLNIAAVRMELTEHLAKVKSNRKWRRNQRELLIYGFAALALGALIYFLSQQRA